MTTRLMDILVKHMVENRLPVRCFIGTSVVTLSELTVTTYPGSSSATEKA